MVKKRFFKKPSSLASEPAEYTLSVPLHKARQGVMKLATGLSPNLRKLCADLFVWDLPADRLNHQENMLAALQAALEANRRIVIHYKKPNRSLAAYHIEPYYLYVKNGALYLNARIVGDGALRTFRVIRIQRIKDTAVCFTSRHYNFQRLHQHTFGVFSGSHSETVVVYFDAEVLAYIEEVIWHGSQQISPQPDGGIHFQVDVAAPREVFWWAMSWGRHAVILKPDWLRKEARQTAEDVLAHYSDSDSGAVTF